MSVWEELSSTSTTPNPLSYLYPSKSNYLSSSSTNRISPATDRTTFSSSERSQVARSDALFTSTTAVTRTTKQNPPSKSWTHKLGTCVKSRSFRFTMLGIFLGLVLSLGAIIPIVTIWQLSASRTTTAPSASTVGSLVRGSLSAVTGFAGCNMYYCEQNVNFTMNMTVTDLLAVITIQRGINLTYNHAYTSFPFTPNITVETTAAQMVYRFFFQSGQLPPTTYIIGAQFLIPGVNRTTSSDTYSITTTNICGQVNSISGTF